MQFEAAMASVETLKRFLGHTSTTHDALFRDILLGVSGAIEAEAGRPLRRGHALVERFAGGDRTIRVRQAPIAQIHSIRESTDRDFETAGAYEELVEGEDYVLESDQEGEPAGHCGVIRRLNGRWLGSEKNPGLVRVEYTGGYKTDDEATLENSSVSAYAAYDYTVDYDGVETYSVSEEDEDTITAREVDANQRAAIQFDTEGLVLPTWRLIEVELKLTMAAGGSGTHNANIVVPNLNLMTSPLSSIYGACGDAGRRVTPQLLTSTDFTTFTFTITYPAYLVWIEQQIRRGYAAFGAFMSTDMGFGTYGRIRASEHTDPLVRPQVAINHRPELGNAFVMPNDLEHACVLQAAHVFKTRGAPGFTRESTGGTPSGSGASYGRPVLPLLPAVERIARRYRWIV